MSAKKTSMTQKTAVSNTRVYNHPQSRRMCLAPFLLVLAALTAMAPLSAQSGNAGIVNTSEGTAYIISLPTDSRQFRQLQEAPLNLPGLIRQNAGSTVAIPAGGISRMVPSYRQESLITGYVHLSGSLRHPLILMRIPANSAGKLFQLDSSHFVRDESGGLVTVSSMDDALPGTGSQKIDGRVVDWIQISDTLRFKADAVPLRIRRESPGTNTAIPAEDSLFVSRGGTGLDRVKFSSDDLGLYGMFTTHQQIVDGMSFILYFYSDRRGNIRNSYTIEVPVAGSSGHVVLWGQDGSAEIAGSYRRGEFFLEFHITREMLPGEITRSLEGGSQGSFDISTGFTDGQVYEEFMYASIPAAGLISR